MKDLRNFIATTIREYLNENQTDVLYKRNDNGNIIVDDYDVNDYGEIINMRY